MESKVNYTIVGIFVLAFSAVLVVLSLWLSAGTGERLYNTYVTYMYQSVSGLNPNAAVKYRGVDVGEVRGIFLDKDNPERVKLVLDIEEGTPIKRDTVAILATQGITGLAFIELTGGTKQSPKLKPRIEPPYPEIESGPSLLVRMDVAVTELISRLTDVSKQFQGVALQINQLLSDDNVQSSRNILSDLERVMNVVGRRTGDLDQSLDNMTIILDRTAQASENMPQLFQDVGESARGIREAVKTINSTASNIENMVSMVEKNVVKSSGDTLSQASQLLSDIRELTVSLDRVVDQFERNPGMIIYGRRETSPGPGETQP